MCEEIKAENVALAAEAEENHQVSRQEVTAARKELRDQIAYAKAVEADKKLVTTELDDLKC